MLRGLRVLVTRPAAQARLLCSAIRAQGGEALALPLMRIEPLSPDEPGAGVPVSLAGADLAIFVSANAVRQAFAAVRERSGTWPATLRCLAIGPATQAALARAGADAQGAAGAMDSEALLAHPLLAGPAGRRIVLVKGEGGRELIAARLRELGARVEEWIVYRRRPVAIDPAAFERALRDGRINALTAASGETLELLLGLLAQVAAGTIPAETPVVVPGPRVAELALRAGHAAVEVASNATDAAMLAALARIAARAAPTLEH